MSLLEKLKKNSTIKDSAILAKSKFFTDKDIVPTEVPMVNVALSGQIDGGLTPGLTMWAGPSKHFKTAFSLLISMYIRGTEQLKFFKSIRMYLPSVCMAQKTTRFASKHLI